MSPVDLFLILHRVPGQDEGRPARRGKIPQNTPAAHNKQTSKETQLKDRVTIQTENFKACQLFGSKLFQ